MIKLKAIDYSTLNSARSWRILDVAFHALWYRRRLILFYIGDPVVTLFHSGTPTGLVSGTLIEDNLTSSDLPSLLGLVNKMPTGEIRGQIEMANATMMSNFSMTTK